MAGVHASQVQVPDLPLRQRGVLLSGSGLRGIHYGDHTELQVLQQCLQERHHRALRPLPSQSPQALNRRMVVRVGRTGDHQLAARKLLSLSQRPELSRRPT